MTSAGQEIRFREGARYGGHLIIPVVRTSWIAMGDGAAGLAEPMALLCGSAGTWYFFPLVPGFSREDLQRVCAAQKTLSPESRTVPSIQ